MIPGEIITAKGEIELNAGRATVTVTVANTGDRPIQVGSHYHFFETNDALEFDRAKARGFRLDIPAGTAVRFEPGQSREVNLVAFAGARKVFGFQGKVVGALDKVARDYPYSTLIIDKSSIDPTLAAMGAVLSEYIPQLNYGKFDDPAKAIKEMRQKLKDAGYEDVRASLQKDVDVWAMDHPLT